MRLVVADGAKEHIPFGLPWVYGLFFGFPGDIGGLETLVLIEPGGWGMNIARELGGALGSVNEGGEVVVAIGYVAAGHQGLGAVGPSVLDGVGVEVLAAIGAAGEPPAPACV